MADDGYTTIHRTTDVAQGELLAEMLRREGIDARFRSVSSTLIGMPALLIEMTVDVPVASEARARELIADLEYTGAAEELEGGEEVDDGGDDAGAESGGGAAAGAGTAASGAPALSRRRPIFAVGFAVFLPGGAHLYARRAWTALVLATGVVACLAIVVTTRSALTFEFAVAILLATVACDAVGGVRAARAEARGEHRSRGRQIARGLGLLGAAIAVGGGARFATGAPRLIHTMQLAQYGVACSDSSIVVENRGDDAREVEISHLEIVASTLFGQETYDVGIKGTRFLNLPPGAHAGVTPNVADWLARSCGFPTMAEQSKGASVFVEGLEALQLPTPRSMHCAFAFSFAAREQAASGADALGGTGFCVPPRSAGTTATGKLNPLR